MKLTAPPTPSMVFLDLALGSYQYEVAEIKPLLKAPW